jgi:hypothetical protein
MITNHFFNLIQCYSEQGVCYYKDYCFGIISSAIVPICWFILFILIYLGFMFIYTKMRRPTSDD